MSLESKLKCSYYEHSYPGEVQQELHPLVMNHVHERHPEKWKMAKPDDVWVMER